MKSIVWRLRTGDNEEFIYRLQCSSVSIKSEQKLFSIFDGWQLAGEVWDIRENKDYIFQKSFKSEAEFFSWTRLYPWELELLSSTSETVRKLKRSYSKSSTETKKKKRGRPKKRKPTQCKKCGGFGHNVRTCKI